MDGPSQNEMDHYELIRMVAYTVCKKSIFCRRMLGNDVGEYITASYLGLRQALEGYDDKQGEWNRYAWKVMKRSIYREASRARLVRIGDAAQQQAIQVMRGKKRTHKITDKSVIAALEWLTKERKDITVLTDNEKPVGYNFLHDLANKESVELGLSKLSAFQAMVVRKKYGIGCISMKIPDIVKECGESKQAVKYAAEEGLRKLKRMKLC
jgi:hypothetical protein